MLKDTFFSWINEFIDKKTNELKLSNERLTKRTEVLTFNLNTAPTQPIEINVPFNTIFVEKITTTSNTSTPATGSIKVMFDNPNLMNQAGAIELFNGQSLVSKYAVSKAFITWTAQPNLSAVVCLTNDILPPSNPHLQRISSNAIYNSINAKQITTGHIRISRKVAGVSSYTISGLLYAIVNWNITTNAASNVSIDVDGDEIVNSQAKLMVLNGSFMMTGGETINITVTGANGSGYAQIANFSTF